MWKLLSNGPRLAERCGPEAATWRMPLNVSISSDIRCLSETVGLASLQQPSAALREAREAIMFARRLGPMSVSKGAFENFAVLRNRDFRLLFGGQVVSVFGDRMVSVALSFAVLGIGGSASDVGFVLAAYVVALVGGVLVGGVVADRTSPRRVMVASDLLRLASQATVATLLITGAAHIWMLAGL